ncbi:MAG: DUF5615 family PIN-like protein [Halobacteriales archaeon]
MLRERGHEVEQAKDRFGEQTSDRELLRWCDEHDTVLISNNAKDFEPLHQDIDHTGVFLFYDQSLPDEDPEGLARTVDEVLNQYGTVGVRNELVALDEWYDWLH